MRALIVAAALAACGCSRPEPPALTPEQAQVTSIGPSGVDLAVTLEAQNPNSIDIATRSVTAKITLDGKFDLGTVKVATPLTLPAHKRTKLIVPLAVKWNDLSGLVSLAMQSRAVPYAVDGSVTLGVEALSFNVPFHIGGAVTHAELVQATARSLPALGLPGLR
jgi:LEA14-like dessication related protein